MQIQLRPYFAFCAEFESVLKRLFDSHDGMSETMLLISIQTVTHKNPEDVLRDMLERFRLIETHAVDSTRYQLTSANRIHLAHVLDMDTLQSAGVTLEMARGITRQLGFLGDLIPDRVDEAIEKIREINHATAELRASTKRLHGAIHRDAHRLRTDEIPADKRFRTIGELWDGHIIPLYRHVQPDGEIERALGEVINDMTQHLANLVEGSELYDACYGLRAEAGRTRREALERFTSVHSEVLPLHQARSRHLLLEQGVELLLESVRRHGPGPAGANLDARLPLTSFRFGVLFDDIEIVEKLSAVMEYKPTPVRAIIPPGPPITPPFDRLAAIESLKSSLPIADLFQAAIDMTISRPLSDTLALYSAVLKDASLIRKYDQRRVYHHNDGPLDAAVVSVSAEIMRVAT